jgi:hypothetical protein
VTDLDCVAVVLHWFGCLERNPAPFSTARSTSPVPATQLYTQYEARTTCIFSASRVERTPKQIAGIEKGIETPGARERGSSGQTSTLQRPRREAQGLHFSEGTAQPGGHQWRGL